MTFADWPADEPHPVSLPAIVSSTDLFDGELFGDELIDIYNSTVDTTTASSGKERSNNRKACCRPPNGLMRYSPVLTPVFVGCL